MTNPVIAIGLDAADPNLLEKWMAQGHLKTLRRLREQGAYGRLNNTVNYNGLQTETSSTERLWVMFGTGCPPEKTSYWTPINYNPKNYEVTHDTVNGAYDFKDYPPFYALGDDFKVAAFDVPVSALSEGVRGMQILGWGGHAPHTPSHSEPAEVLPELIKQYGKNPVLHQDYGYWWDKAYHERIKKGLKTSIDKRSAICRDLLQRENWDLFLTVFGETHTAEHDFWHLSQADNPLYSFKSDGVNDPMSDVFEDVDRAIAEIIEASPDNAYILVFALHGMGNNVTDMCSMTFLPELLYRYNFPGKFGIGWGKLGANPPPILTNPRRKSWPGEIWQKRYDPNPIKRWLMPWTPSKFDRYLNAGSDPRLTSPYQLREESVALNWMPAMWYQNLWSQMKAFTLPAFAAGHIRINLKGREKEGAVELAEYESFCDQITALLYRLKDGRTGEPIVKDVVRTRTQENALSCDPKLPDPDLVVLWREIPTDVVDSPDFGRIGPLTYYRSGGHRPHGFLMAKGPGIKAGSSLPGGQAMDLGPTILKLMGATIPKYCNGSPLVEALVSNLAA